MGEFIVKDLGAVSGYAIAVEHGFVGTEQDWINFITGSTDAAVLSESYAKGGTGTRTGEDTDNAKYYAERSEHFATAPEWAEVQHKPNTLAGYGVSEVPTALLDGVIGIEHIPQGALERVIPVADDTARFALTTSDVQLGDTVKVLSTGLMYAVIDTAHLDSESGYTVYTAGAASSVPWSGVTTKPTSVSGYGITDTYTKTEEDNLLNSKVDKVSGKGLSTEDYTTNDKNKLDSIEANAEVNVQSDWSESDSSSDAFIKNKPTTLGGFGITDAYTKSEVDTALAEKANASAVYTKTETDALLDGKVDKVQGKGLSTEDFTTAEKNKLSGIEAGAEVNVNADWNADGGDAQILNKPQIYTKSEMDTALGNKADVSALTAHTSDKNNPHEVTAAQVHYGTSTVASALAEMAGDIADVQNVINLLYDTDFILNADNYKPMMQLWFMLRNADDMTPAELTALCDEWYTVTRRAWHGWVVFPSSGNSYATRYGDLVGVVVEPSTRETEARDDLKGNPLFATMDCNWTIDSTTKEPVITAIDGVTSGFVRDDPTVFVGVLQMSGYFYQSFDQSGDETNGYSSTYLEGYGMVPVKESIRPDGTVRPWVVHGKYMSGQRIENSTEYMTCCSGQKVKAYNKSHNTLHTMAPRSGTGFSGGTVVDWTWLEIMHRIVYACMASDPINAGCLSYNYTAYAQVAETDVKRILCTPSAVTSIGVGSCVLVGTVSSDNKSDRGAAACYSISGQLGAIVTGKENVEVGGVTYTAVYVDTDSTFTTAANGNGVAGTTLIMTFHWPTGALDNVKGHNGSIAANTSGKYPALLQGIEYMVGAYDVFADIIVKWIVRDGANVAEFYVVNDATDQASDVTADYVKVGELVPGSGSNNWYYISKMVYQNGVFVYASVAGGSSSTFTRDQAYVYKDGATTGLREWPAFCDLTDGVARGGLSASYLYDGLGLATWYIAARLSPNGTRGELTA